MEKNNEYGMVDLGLPSGLKWADRNVGAESPEAYGDYFAWGETAPRGENWSADTPYDWAHAPFNFDETYFNEHKSEWLTEDGTLKPVYDAAHAAMGGSWRMPTSAEMQELLDGTTQSVEELNGISGMRFTSKDNGNSIFMPFAGLRHASDVSLVGNLGGAWSSSLNAGYAYGSHLLGFYNYGIAYVGYDYRFIGFVVRGVHE